jgi:hypothetical protein
MLKQFLLAATLIALPVAGFSIFQLTLNTSNAVAGQPVLGDLSSMVAVVKDTKTIAATGDLVSAEKRITDFESLWDTAEPTLRPINKEAWVNVDSAADTALKSLRAKTVDAAKVTSALDGLLASLDNPMAQVE